jgi:hypothetical protein
MGFEVAAVVRDYNGAVIKRNEKNEIIEYKIDELSEIHKKKNIEKFGKLDKNGNLVGCKVLSDGKIKKSEINKMEEEIKNQIKESNKRYEKWQQEQ